MTTTTETTVQDNDQRTAVSALYFPQNSLRVAFAAVIGSVDVGNSDSRYPLGNVQLLVDGKQAQTIGCDGRRMHYATFAADNAAAIAETAANDRCAVPEFSNLENRLSVLVPLTIASKIAAVPGSGFSCQLITRRVNGQTVCALTYRNGHNKTKTLEFQANEGRYPRVSDIKNGPRNVSAWIVGPCAFLADMLRPTTQTTISLNGHAMASGFKHGMNDCFRARHRKDKNPPTFKHSGEIELNINGNYAADFLGTFHETIEARIEFDHPETAVKILATCANVDCVALIMPTTER